MWQHDPAGARRRPGTETGTNDAHALHLLDSRFGAGVGLSGDGSLIGGTEVITRRVRLVVSGGFDLELEGAAGRPPAEPPCTNWSSAAP